MNHPCEPSLYPSGFPFLSSLYLSVCSLVYVFSPPFFSVCLSPSCLFLLLARSHTHLLTHTRSLSRSHTHALSLAHTLSRTHSHAHTLSLVHSLSLFFSLLLSISLHSLPGAPLTPPLPRLVHLLPLYPHRASLNSPPHALYFIILSASISISPPLHCFLSFSISSSSLSSLGFQVPHLP